ncbi:DUF72 domain-containing protein [Haliangium ochraceum]|nr:DUF72 domain-containing protein [Haliangium ochraceum]
MPRARYFGRLPYLETAATLRGIPRPPVLQRWLADAGEDGRFGLAAPQTITHRAGRKGYARHIVELSRAELAQTGGFRDTELIRSEVDALAQATSILGVDVVLFRSPADFAPSASNRDAMRRFFAELAPAERFSGALRVWEPQGLWDLDVAARFAGELGLVLCCDPLTNDPMLDIDPGIFSRLPSDDAYFRVTGIGNARRRLDDYALEPLFEAAEAYERVWVALGHDGKYPDALRLHRQLNGDPGDGEADGDGESAARED